MVYRQAQTCTVTHTGRHTYTRTYATLQYATFCVGDPIKKKSIVAAHIVRQADRQNTVEKGRERGRECKGGMAHLWHRLLLTYAIKLSRTTTTSSRARQFPNWQQIPRGNPLRKCLHLYSCIIKTEYAVQCFLSLASLATPPRP